MGRRWPGFRQHPSLQAGVESPSPIVSQLPPPLLLVLSGPSGVGKDAVLARLAEKGLVFRRVPTAPTRRRRANERDGVDYCFLSDEEFDRLLASGGLLEHAEVYGLRYGVPKAPVQEALAAGEERAVRGRPA